MKKFAVAAALLTAIVATPAMAAEGGEGRVELRGGLITGNGIDEGTIGQILVAEGTDNVKVGTVIATIAGEGEEASSSPVRAEPVEAPPTPFPRPQDDLRAFPPATGRPDTRAPCSPKS